MRNYADYLIQEYLKGGRSQQRQLQEHFKGHSEPGPARVIPQFGGRFMELPDGHIVPKIGGSSRQYFADVINDPPIASGGNLTSTSEELMWAPTDFTRIPANDARPSKIYEVTVGGTNTLGTTGVMSFTPRLGLVIGSPTLGVTIVPVAPPTTIITANAFYMKFTCVCRVIGAAGANSTFVGTGMYHTGGLAATGSHYSIEYGGLVATADASIATAIGITKTITAAATFIVFFVYIQSLN
jgi:hypothetical protein